MAEGAGGAGLSREGSGRGWSSLQETVLRLDGGEEGASQGE